MSRSLMTSSLGMAALVLADLAWPRRVFQCHLLSFGQALQDLHPLEARETDPHRTLLEEPLPGFRDVQLARGVSLELLLAGLRLVEGLLEQVDHLTAALLED